MAVSPLTDPALAAILPHKPRMCATRSQGLVCSVAQLFALEHFVF